ncbi:secretory phospholipase A2 receptor-like [Triplophysa dalaica]|uniref:secretory phospholipase A2 receptor-like n=1 Tax=Triplophysa dalaica TaxID=1582913 RepID=UPI0024DFE549|nr:secretory phospholipase A2 receptor-like [Triplophysa dalaica]
MEVENIYSNIQDNYCNRPGDQDRDVNEKTLPVELMNSSTKATNQNYRRRCLALSALCFGLLCVFLVVTVLVLQIQISTERNMKLSCKNTLMEFNETINDIQANYSQLTTEKDQLQHRFNSLEAELKKRNSERRYHFSDERKSWSESRQVCRDRGGDLVVINNIEEQRYLSSVIKESTWIGLSDIDKEGSMKWVDNSPLKAMFWIPGEPNNAHGIEDCVQIVSSYSPDNSWNDQPCTEKRRWICYRFDCQGGWVTPEAILSKAPYPYLLPGRCTDRCPLLWVYVYSLDRSATRNTFGPETENQKQTGAQNRGRRRWFMRITVCLLLICVFLLVTFILLYNQLKTERDQMKNKVEEKSKDLNSLNIKCKRLIEELQKNLTSVSLKKLELETNYRHLTDERDQLQTSLTFMSRSLLEFETEKKRKRCQKVWKESDRYFISNEEKSWSDSRRFCKDCGADLVIINTEEEQKHISSIVEGRVWIGLSDTENEGNMTWVDNTPLTKGFWNKGEPNNVGDEDCVEFMSSSEPVLDNWNDLSCSVERKWICENQG